MFCIGAVITTLMLQYRRYKKAIHGELGGPVVSKTVTGIILVFIWIIYLVVNALDAYCIFSNSAIAL